MRSFLRTVGALLLTAGLVASCGGGGNNNGNNNGGGGGGGGSAFEGVWQYEEGSYSFVNCGFSSTQVPLARSGFVIQSQAGKLVRTNPDKCVFTVVQSTPTNAAGMSGEQCTVNGTDLNGNPQTTRYTLKSLSMVLFNNSTQMTEVFSLDATQTTSLGTYTCEISSPGSNTLYRAP